MQIDLRTLALCASVASLSCASVVAQDARSISFMTGNSLLELCRTQPEVAAVYTAGVVDGINGVAALSDTAAPFCMPASVSNEQVKDLACTFAADNPDVRHYPASVFVQTSMMDAFPCQ